MSALGGFVVGWITQEGRHGLAEEAPDIGALQAWSTPGLAPDLQSPKLGTRHRRYETYPEAKRVPLPRPHYVVAMTVEQALSGRRSQRIPAASPLSLQALSTLLDAAQSITDGRQD